MENLKTCTYFVMDGHEFEKLVESVFGFEYSAVASNEWNNYARYECKNVKANSLNSDYAQKYTMPDILENIQAKKEVNTLSYQDAIEYMVFIGVLPEGNYLIDPSW